ncbi:MAG: aldehyde dehydrogenase [Paludibacteraceae bacterium]|nr:aldehyde dehydrogenase [Paludibacteraceae bacterium]
MIENIHKIRQVQSDFFRSGATLDVRFRRKMLERFAEALDKWEGRLCDALWADLHKSYEEAYLTEISIVKAEVRTHLRKLSQWSRKRRVTTPLKLFPSQSYIVKEPLGNALIIAPWNYPMQLLLNPLVGAISAGCTAVLKPSPYVPTVSGVIAEMIKETFDEAYVAVVQGNRDVNKALLNERWDMIFFTGSPSLGKTVMAAAARHLTPVVLELGGKSPCIVDKSADIKVAARRIAWGKTLNSGQTCIAPDYILIHKDVKDEFVHAFAEAMRQLHGEDLKSDRHYVRMVNDKAFYRVASYIEGSKVLYGGNHDASERYIEPTLLDNPPLDSPVMTEEIFGPVFPMITIEGEFVDSVVDFVTSREKPLALYYFGRECDGWEVIRRTSSGGGCINDVIMHIANEHVAFGGVGNSGMGRYHGRDSFEAFSHTRSMIATATWIDLPFRYMPYKVFSLVKRLL